MCILCASIYCTELCCPNIMLCIVYSFKVDSVNSYSHMPPCIFTHCTLIGMVFTYCSAHSMMMYVCYMHKWVYMTHTLACVLLIIAARRPGTMLYYMNNSHIIICLHMSAHFTYKLMPAVAL